MPSLITQCESKFLRFPPAQLWTTLTLDYEADRPATSTSATLSHLQRKPNGILPRASIALSMRRRIVRSMRLSTPLKPTPIFCKQRIMALLQHTTLSPLPLQLWGCPEFLCPCTDFPSYGRAYFRPATSFFGKNMEDSSILLSSSPRLLFDFFSAKQIPVLYFLLLNSETSLYGQS